MTSSPRSDQWRRHNVGRLLNNAVARFETRILALMAEAGHHECKLCHIQVTRNLDVDGTRLTDLAARAGITKQSMGALVAELETIGLVQRHDDPTDGRARIVSFTPEGLAWLTAFRAAVEAAEDEVRMELGATRYEAFKAGLAIYAGTPLRGI
ncbi:transcriptional regulator [Pigmentiphaga litoralis]|uniref:MarR family winged helix-turn-helix transcriptional regulator n=1 Tax=Pigmentiphaga litoralis TaxID=516702 RepID=UPI001675D7C0|nr:MarR family transcriptional regulator [Pigmentiphaga litoralis]GGX25623.1 transcriptional regulator [Pigmentiphaga litoralis]